MIDKSALKFGEPRRVRDRAWLLSARDRVCDRCGNDGKLTGMVVACHVRAGNEGGTRLKPSDDLVVFMCSDCHRLQEANPGPEFWFDLFKLWLRRRYRMWKHT